MIEKNNIEIFNENASNYEQWFIDNPNIYLSELNAIKMLLPAKGQGIDIGMGTGIFTKSLNIFTGIEPSEKMREIAVKKGLSPIEGVAEKIPFPDNSFDFATMITVICFLENPLTALKEIYRILKKNASLIIAFIPKNNFEGQKILQKKENSVFYKNAKLFEYSEISSFLTQTNFQIEETYQTLFGSLSEIKTIQTPEKGYNSGNFIIIKAQKRIL